MKSILLDTHVWLWCISAPSRLGVDVLNLLEDRENEIYLSAASAWEIAIKYGLGRIPLPEPPDKFITPRLLRDGIRPLPVEHQHACHVANLPDHHRDPFDRILIAQTQIERFTFITADRKLKDYDIEMIFIKS